VHIAVEREKIHLTCSPQYPIAWFATEQERLKLLNPEKNVCFVQGQAEIRLVPEFLVSYVKEKDIITI
jgi:hypothetical protein